jgi:Na+-translocating ferredoxin:NAD+ oxidoreductase RnfG subunit
MDTLLNIKFLEFLALELSVLIAIGAVLLGGLYQIVRDRVRESQRQDQIAPEAL